MKKKFFPFIKQKKIDFLRHAPCMRHVKRDYDICSNQHQLTMKKIGESASTAEQQPNNEENKTVAIAIEEERLKTMCW